MPGEERVEVARDHVLERDEGVAVAERQEAAQELLRDLDAGDDLGVLVGVAEDDPEAQREVRDVGERPAEADHERGQRGVDLLLEEAVELGALLTLGGARRDQADAVLGEGGAQLALHAVDEPRAHPDDALADRVDLLDRG